MKDEIVVIGYFHTSSFTLRPSDDFYRKTTPMTNDFVNVQELAQELVAWSKLLTLNGIEQLKGHDTNTPHSGLFLLWKDHWEVALGHTEMDYPTELDPEFICGRSAVKIFLDENYDSCPDLVVDIDIPDNCTENQAIAIAQEIIANLIV